MTGSEARRDAIPDTDPGATGASAGDPTVSVVIPTRDGGATLPATLRAVAGQTYPHDRLEVLVVDDGSTVGSFETAGAPGGPDVTFLRQEAAGAAAARNRGAASAGGSLLVFLDDDVEMSPGALRALVAVLREHPRAVVVGTLSAPPPSSPFERLEVIPPTTERGEDVTPVDFTECYTGLLGLGADTFASCGPFRDPTGGWPSWDDIDFGYRARLRGVPLLRCRAARAVHHDRHAVDLESLCRRWRAASVSAVRLFQRHPGIQRAFPMYRDKLPVDWSRDRLPLVARKLLRSAASGGPVGWCVRRAAERLARHGRPRVLAQPLCGLALSGAMWRGLRDGVGRHGQIPPGGEGA